MKFLLFIFTISTFFVSSCLLDDTDIDACVVQYINQPAEGHINNSHFLFETGKAEESHTSMYKGYRFELFGLTPSGNICDPINTLTGTVFYDNINFVVPLAKGTYNVSQYGKYQVSFDDYQISNDPNIPFKVERIKASCGQIKITSITPNKIKGKIYALQHNDGVYGGLVNGNFEVDRCAGI